MNGGAARSQARCALATQRPRCRACSRCSIATARRRAWSAAPSATRCWACRSREIDVATTARAGEVMRRVTAAGFKAGADRNRARHGDGRRRQASVRGHDAAQGRRDLSAATPRSSSAATGRPTPSGAISPSTRCRLARDGTVHDYVGGLADLGRAARAFHRRSATSASRKIICASCASSVSMPHMAPAITRCRRPCGLHRRP